MEREIWEIVKALDSKKLTAIEAHKKLCGLYIVSGSSLLNQCLNEQQKENIIEVRHNYSSNGVIESTDYVVNGELVEGFYSLDSLRSTLENIFKFKNIVVKKYGKLSI